MEYTIAHDFYVPEFDVELFEGGVVWDGDLEPDLIAQLVSQGTLTANAEPLANWEAPPEDEE